MKVLLFAVTLFSSVVCMHAQKSRPTAERTIVSDARYLITYRVTGKDVIFTMEDFRAAETGRDWMQKMPDSWFSIYVDINRNSKVDRGVDVSYGVYRNNLSLCGQYLLDDRASTGCGALRSDAYYEKSSRLTSNSPYRHIVHRFTIPRSEIAKGKTREIDVVFHCVTEGDPFWATNSLYPAAETEATHTFNKTLRLHL
jgi:hypothetical protein